MIIGCRYIPTFAHYLPIDLNTLLFGHFRTRSIQNITKIVGNFAIFESVKHLSDVLLNVLLNWLAHLPAQLHYLLYVEFLWLALL